MGCLMSKKAKHEKGQRNYTTRDSIGALSIGNGHNIAKEYSWSKREKKDLARYSIENVIGGLEIRFTGEIDGEQFIISNCQRSTICLYDHCNTVMIDDCTDCTFFIGPVMGSIAIRNCDDCRLMCASQQFRTRDCKRLDLFLFCGTQPAIESCSQLRFGCFSANYNGLKEQFAKAGLNAFNNKWSQVYDFSIDDHERHWNTFPADVKASDTFRSVLLGSPTLNLSFNPATSLVPQTLGITSLEFLQNHQSTDFYVNSSVESSNPHLPVVSADEAGASRLCLVFVYGFDQDGTSIDASSARLLQELQLKHADMTLLMTKSFQEEQVNVKLSLVTEDDAEKSSGGESANNNKPTANRLLALFFQGPDTVATVLSETCSHVFGSSASFKIVSDANEETSNFTHYLSIAFENLISY